MIFISILTLIVAKALPVLSTNVSHIHFTRITSIVFFFTSLLILNSLNLESIGSGLGIYSGLFHITQITQILEFFLFIIGGLILISFAASRTLTFGSAEETVLKKNEVFFKVATAGKGQSKNTYNSIYVVGTENATDYSLIVLFSSLGSALLISSYDLISLYLSIELQSFGLYILSTLYRESESSTGAGLKYFLLGGLSSCIILLGAGLIYSYTGLTNLESLYILNSMTDGGVANEVIDAAAGLNTDINQQYLIQGLSLGLILIFIGFLFKIAAAPLHNWSPDVYDGTPTIVTIWLTIMPKIAILIILLELHTQFGILPVQNINWTANITANILPASLATVQLKNLLLISSFLSLIIGSLLGLNQTKIKRLLAYSTISHIGFLLLALAINSEQSIDSFLFYILQYTLTNLNIFLIILALSYSNIHFTLKETGLSLPFLKEREKCNNTKNVGGVRGTIIPAFVYDLNYILEFKGLFFSNPFLSLSLAISLFSMAGIPPLIGFFSKQFVLYSSIQNGYYFISIIAIIVSVISASYYLKIIKLLFTLPTEGSLVSEQKEVKTQMSTVRDYSSLSLTRDSVITNTHSFIISILTLTIVLFFIKPTLFLNSTQLLSLSLFFN